MIYFIPAQGLPISVQAKLSGRSRSSFYYQRKKPKKDAELLERIKTVLSDHPWYGYRRVAMALDINHKRAHRVMQRARLFSKAMRERRGKNQYSIQKTSLPNLIKHVTVRNSNHVWAGDFTELVYKRRIYYVATVIDLYTRQIIGWHIATNHSVPLVIEALQMAISKRIRVPELFHADHGSEYISEALMTKLQEHGISPSHSHKGKPWQNGIQESFYHRFKQELGDVNRFPSIEKLIEALGQHFRTYNAERIHSALKMTPDLFYARAMQAQQSEVLTSVDAKHTT